MINSELMATSGRKHGRETGQPSREASAQTPRSILVEQEIVLNDFNDIVWDRQSIFSIITDRGWAPIYQQMSVAYPDMVGEFYHVWISKADADTFTFIFRGVSIIISPSAIFYFIGIPRMIGAYPNPTAPAAPIALIVPATPTIPIAQPPLNQMLDQIVRMIVRTWLQ